MEALNDKKDMIFVTGTDTNVGKSVLSLLIMSYLLAQGERPFYLKPIQTGCEGPYDRDSDARFIYENVESLKDKDPADSMIYCFRNPKAPLLAARDEDKEIDLVLIKKISEQKAATCSHLVIEGAGGLMVPVDKETSMADLISITGARPIIAARAGLGTINHTLLTLEALRSRAIEPYGVVFMENTRKGTSPEMIEENRRTIEELSGVMVAGTIGIIEDFSDIPRASYGPLERIFG